MFVVRRTSFPRYPHPIPRAPCSINTMWWRYRAHSGLFRRYVAGSLTSADGSLSIHFERLRYVHCSSVSSPNNWLVDGENRRWKVEVQLSKRTWVKLLNSGNDKWRGKDEQTLRSLRTSRKSCPHTSASIIIMHSNLRIKYEAYSESTSRSVIKNVFVGKIFYLRF